MKKNHSFLYLGIFCVLWIFFAFAAFLVAITYDTNGKSALWFFAIPAVAMIISILIVVCVKIGDHCERKETEEAILNSGIDQIDNLTPFEFEVWVANFLQVAGFKSEVTKRAGDYGIDVVAERDGVRIGIQVKKFSKAVGIKAVQEVMSGLGYYNCSQGWVVTSANGFTKAAMNLAKVNGIQLLTVTDLAVILNRLKKEKGIED